MNDYKYIIRKRCLLKINTFYGNVSKKYKHTYSLKLMEQNVHDAVDSMYQIEKTLLRRKPLLKRWAGFHMANTKKWYYAYLIVGNTIVVEDACHAQNMHEDEKN